MKHVLLTAIVSLFPGSVLAQDAEAVPNCSWRILRDANPNENISLFLGNTVVGDWLSSGGAGFVQVLGNVFPIPEFPAEVITISRKNDRLFATNQSGSATIELYGAGTVDWSFDDNDPIGSDDTSVLNRRQIEFESGCPVNDLPNLVGRGTWEVPGRGALEVTLFFVPVEDNFMHVVMEGEGEANGRAFHIRRGYTTFRLEAEPLTEE